jgi:hypothetical protein
MARVRDVMRLRGRSGDELRVRGTQTLLALRDRARIARRAEPSTEDVFAAGRGASGAALLDGFRARATPRLSPAFADRGRTAAELRERFGETSGPKLVARADRIVDGRFDLLGFRGLTFGSPVDWQLDPVSGERLPLLHWSRLTRVEPASAFDRKVVWELNRHQSFVVLGRAYWLTNDERYAEAFARQLDEWIEANPVGLGINWCSSLEVALRTISWTWALSLFRDSERLTPELFLRALSVLGLQARHVAAYRSTYFSPNTHLTGEALGLFVVGTLWPEFREAPAWMKTGSETLVASLERHVPADGVYFERSTGYHLYSVDFYTHFFVTAAANGVAIPSIVRDRLAALLDHLLYIARPDGTIPLLGDDDGGRLLPLAQQPYGDARSRLALGAGLLGRPEWKTIGHDATEEMLWLLGADALSAYERLKAKPPAGTSRAFSLGGVYTMRDGWSESASVLTLDCGEHGGSHDHAGALGFDLSVLGRPVLVDPGTYSYLRGGERDDFFRSTAAHNTIVVDGQSSSVPSGPFSWAVRARASARAWRAHPRYDFFEGSHDGYLRFADPVTHIRSVLLVKDGYWIVRDRVVAAGAHRYDLRFHFLPDAQPLLEDVRGTPVIREASLQIVTFGPGSWHLSTEHVSRCYGAREQARVAAFTAHAQGPQEFVTFLLPREDATVQELPALARRAFEVRHGTAHDVFVAHEDGRCALEAVDSSCAE